MAKSVTPTERELDILKILWRLENATVRQVWRELSGEDRELSYTTVLSLLQNMEKKGLVGHQAAGKAYLYYPAVRREETVGMLAGRFLEKVFDGAMDQYMVHALDWRNVSLEELDRLEAMIADAKKKRQSSQPPHEKGDEP
jgi:BlaI family penicillinase repressor